MPALESKLEDLVHSLVPLGSLSPQSQNQLLNKAEVLRFKRGESVFREGDSDPYSFYLLEGRLELLSGGQTIQRLAGGSPSAAHALAQLQPRKMSARAESEVKVLRVDRDLLDRLAATEIGDGFSAVQVNEIDADDDGDWMTRMLQSKLFSHLPASNIHRIFSLLEHVEVKAGETVVSQGEPGDFYYVIAQGRCEVTRSAGPNAPGYRLALIGAGDAFGEEALVAGSTRNATVRMLTDGQLVRLPKEGFIELIQRPLLSGVSIDQGRNIVAARDAVWLDVRFPEEHQRDGLENSANHPLNTLRMHSGRLDVQRTYIVYCDTGTRSAVAAFLLAERGFDVHYLEGGLTRYGLIGQISSTPSVKAAPPPKPDLTLHDDSGDVTAEVTALATAPIPKSHQTEAERVNDPVVKAAALSVELELNAMRIAEYEARAESGTAAVDAAAERAAAEAARAEVVRKATETARLEAERQAAEAIEAERVRVAVEISKARQEAEQAAEVRIQAEKRRLEAAAAKARREWLEAQRLKAEAEQARAEAAATIERERAELREKAEHERVEVERKQQDEARMRAEKERLEAAATNARRELLEAQRIKAEVERQQAAAEAARERELAEQLEKVEYDRQEAERRRKADEEERRAEKERLEAAAADARRELLEAQRIKAEAESALERERAEQRARAEQERIEAEHRQHQEEEQRRAEKERLEATAADARRELLEAQRMKAEIEQAKAEAEAAVERERAAQQAKVEQVRAEMERKLKEEERKLRESYAWQAEELRRLQAQKAEAEVRLREEQQRVQIQAEESRARLAEARDYQQRLEQAQQASAQEAEMREQQQLDLERKLREELRHKVQSERRHLEEELARNASELARARSERATAEAARVAAAEEARHIVEEFKEAHARKRLQEEADMRAERERLEAESKRLRLALEIAQHETHAAIETQNRVEFEIAEIKRAQIEGSRDATADMASLAALEAQAAELARQVEASERTRADAQAAAVASAGDLAAHTVHEQQVRADLKDEIDTWLKEQDELENSDVQRGILANQRAHMERIKKRAQSVREAAKAHDQALVNELADKLRSREPD